MKNSVKRKIILPVSLLLVALFIPCTFKGEDDNTYKKVIAQNDVSVWTAPTNTKIMQDNKDYSSLKAPAHINILMAKNEYENSQIILTPTKDIDEYDIVLSDLKSSNGATLSKDNIKVYNQKYIRVNENFENNGAKEGLYPDALLPFEIAKKYKENNVKKGNNQGITFSFYVPKETKKGVYEGNFELIINNKSSDIPVKITVSDITISEENRTKSIFSTGWQFHHGELSTSQDTVDSYNKTLLKYRLNAGIIVHDTVHSDDDINFYVDLAYDYMQDPNCSTIVIPWKSSSVMYNKVSYGCQDGETFTKYLKKFAQKSFEKNYNMFDKLTCVGFNDEPLLAGTTQQSIVVAQEFNRVKKAVSDEIRNSSENSTLKNDVADGIENLKNVVTSQYDEVYEGNVETFCPKVNYYDTKEDRQHYKNQEERWWYTCNEPRYPYPTYHIEDSLLSARAMGWMQGEYEVTGNLYWATNIYANFDGRQYNHIEDYYNGSAERYRGVNGDGYLFYPGKQYGLKEPVVTNRLEAIRDGLEENELLISLRENYNNISSSTGLKFNADNAIHSLTNNLYQGTKVYTSDQELYKSRNQLFEMLTLSSGNAKACIIDYEDNNLGNKIYKLYVKDGYNVKNNGEVINPIESKNGGKIYSIELSSLNNNSKSQIIIEGNNESYELNLGNNEVSTIYDTDAICNYFFDEEAKVTKKVVNASDFFNGAKGKLTQLTLSKTDQNTSQGIMFKNENILNTIGENTSKIVFNVYYKAKDNETLSFTLYTKFANKSYYINENRFELRDGLNVIELSGVNYYNWEEYGKLEHFGLYFGDDVSQPERNNIFIQDMIVYSNNE